MVSALGTTTVGIVFSILILILSYFTQILYKYRQERETGMTIKEAFAKGFVKSVLLTVGVYLVCVLIFYLLSLYHIHI